MTYESCARGGGVTRGDVCYGMLRAASSSESLSTSKDGNPCEDSRGKAPSYGTVCKAQVQYIVEIG